MTDRMNDLDRYTELSIKNRTNNGILMSKDEYAELQSLYAKIEGKIEKLDWILNDCQDDWGVAYRENKDLESQVAKLKEERDEQIVVYNDIKREASDYRNEVLKSKTMNDEYLKLKSTLEKIKTKLNDRQYYLWVEKYDLIADIETIFEDNK